MKTLRFEGFSDDTFGEMTSRIESCNCSDGEPIQFDVYTPDGAGVRVSGCYGKKLGNGCWMIGAEALSEDKPVNWPIRLYPSHGFYQGRMEIEAPDDAIITEAQG